ncbi:MAG: fumarate hydratase [Anaerolineales bacterium]|jgi:fumarate hydratase subunit alpha|nr:fumarate hydratase [Alphaproteobacteria bacterium]MDP7643624.1 fumarate hydratase [Anaerolineales bacterium]|tara:strand:+ start:7057 stop:7902 length:846 start_codon:yes stop_codon:yes gene_type:complete
MRTVDLDEVTTAVSATVQSLNFHTAEPTFVKLTEVLENEPSPAGRQAMHDIVENRRIASERQVPMCQDTGMVIVFVKLGEQVRPTGGDLRTAITEGVRQGYKQGYLRKSVVAEPLFDRMNTGDNTPPIIHFDLVPGDRLRLIIAAKGFGAENMSWAKILPPAQGIEGVKREVVQAVIDAGPNACPPVVVGVGVGGTLEMATLLAKKALMRDMGMRHPDRRYAALELELLDLINATGVGPQGWGGANTALDVRVEYFATHIAAIPLAVNLDCHLHRHAEVVI